MVATAGLMLATALQGADPLTVNVALPAHDRYHGSTIELGTWVITAFLCATAVAAPLTGWLRRRFGALPLFTWVVWAFISTSLLCAFSSSFALLIPLRVLQGSAGGLILPLVQAILLDLYPRERHGRILGMLGAAFMLGPILGPLLGGLVTDLISWRAVFVINVPLGLLAIAATRGLRCQEEEAEARPIDIFAIVLLTVAVGGVQLSLERGVGHGWRSPELLIEMAAAVLGIGGLATRAWRSGFAVFRPAVFRDVNFAVAAFYNFMTSGLIFVAIVFLPNLAEGPLAYSATLAGVTIVPRAAVLMLMMLVVGELMGRVDHRILLGGGWLLMALGLLILSQIRVADGLAWMILGSTVQSLGAGLLFTPHSTLAYATLPRELRTDAAGVFSLLRQLGYASSVALMTAVLRLLTGGNALGAGGRVAGIAALHAYCQCFRMMAVAALVVIPGIFLFRLPQFDAAEEAASAD